MSIEKKRERAKALFGQGKPAQARRLLEQVCRQAPDDVEAWFLLGITCGAGGDMAAAARAFERTVALMPELAEGHFNLAKAHFELGRFDRAIEHYRRALALRPDWPPVLNNLGNTFMRIGEAEEALGCYQRAVALAPDYVEAIVNQCNAVQLLGRYEEALAGYRRVLELKPGHPLALTNLGTTLLKLERFDEAIECCREARRLYPDNPGPLAIEAKIELFKGAWQRAHELIAPLVEKFPDNIQVVTTFVAVAHRVGAEERAIELARAVLENPGPATPTMRIDLHFELGHLLDRIGRYDEAFEQFRRGNALKPGRYDAEREEQATNHKIATLSAEAVAAFEPPSVRNDRPLFIVGMPRSGTSLVEQILDCHPDVTGGGELYTIDLLAQKSETLTGHPYPESLLHLDGDQAGGLARRYLKKLDAIDPASRYVSDKMPQNFLHLGLIARLFPGARVVHCQRDPVDTCLSCYFQNFKSGQLFSKDLAAAGHYYRQYEKLMAHWKRVLPIEILEIRYETLVENQERETRRLLDFLDLPWDERCLAFHENRRIVATASIEQVRQPLYRRSVARWRRYQHHIGPLLESLGLTPDDA